MNDKIIIGINGDEGDVKSLCPYGMGFMIYKSMQKYKDNIAQIDVINGNKDTYHNFLQRSIRIALELKSRGITREDIITLNTSNHLDSSVPFIAAQFLGCKVASLDPSIPVEDARYLLEQVKPRIIFTISSAKEDISEAIKNFSKKPEIVVFGTDEFDKFLKPKNNQENFQPVKVDPMETAVILFSSGTTGLPKGICCNHLMLVQSGKIVLHSINSELLLAYSTLYWISAVNLLIEACRIGTTRLVVPKFDPAQFWTIVEAFKVTMFFCAPTQIVQITKMKPNRKFNIKSLSTALVGGGPLPILYVNEMRQHCPDMNIIQGWGQTELGIVTKFMNSTSHRELQEKNPTSCGVLLPGFAAKIVNVETNTIAGSNETGEIRIKATYQMNGYYNKDSVEAWDDDGFICTGDIGYYNDSKCFFIVDRLKEMIKYQSWHVTPVKIESILLKHSSIAEVVVIGIPHDVDGDHPMGLVVLKKQNIMSITPDDIRKYADEQLDERHKLRGGVLFINKLLYTVTGKVRRAEMRTRILNGVTTF